LGIHLGHTVRESLGQRRSAVAGAWEKTRDPGVYVQEYEAAGKTLRRYKVVFRDGRGKVTSRTFTRHRDALDKKAELRGQRSRGELLDASLARKTLSELWDHFAETSRVKASTMHFYENSWHVHVEPVLKHKRLKDFRRGDLERFYSEVEGRTTLATRRAVQQLVRRLFTVAVNSEWIQRNPAAGIPMPSADEREPRFLTEKEVGAIAKNVPPRYGALVWTLAVAGLRIGEATALRVKNLNGVIRVVENSPEVEGKKVTGTPKTRGSRRDVPIAGFLRQILKQHLQTYSNIFDSEAYVFTSARGDQVRQGNFLRRVFKPAATAAGIQPVPTVHDLRHTAAALMLRHGMTPYEVAKILGHSSVKMVEERYGHLYEHELQRKIEDLGAKFGEA
jgi:integrase